MHSSGLCGHQEQTYIQVKRPCAHTHTDTVRIKYRIIESWALSILIKHFIIDTRTWLLPDFDKSFIKPACEDFWAPSHANCVHCASIFLDVFHQCCVLCLLFRVCPICCHIDTQIFLLVRHYTCGFCTCPHPWPPSALYILVKRGQVLHHWTIAPALSRAFGLFSFQELYGIGS